MTHDSIHISEMNRPKTSEIDRFEPAPIQTVQSMAPNTKKAEKKK